MLEAYVITSKRESCLRTGESPRYPAGKQRSGTGVSINSPCYVTQRDRHEAKCDSDIANSILSPYNAEGRVLRFKPLD
jgi:hypothetical protein